MLFVWLMLTSFVISLLLLPQLVGFLREKGLVSLNYRDREVVTGSGLLFVLAVPGGVAAAAVIPAFYYRVLELQTGVFALLVLVIGCALFGFVDDVLGGAETKGFRGHLGELARGKMTTGALKAIGCTALALLAVAPLVESPLLVLLGGLVIALSINTFNLLDLRPGRALKVYLLAMLGLAAVIGQGELAPFWGLVVAPALILLPGDLSERSMLGDVGSNVIGAVVGLAFVASVGWQGQLVLLVLLVGINLYSEKRSISDVISRWSLLRRFDELGRTDRTTVQSTAHRARLTEG